MSLSFSLRHHLKSVITFSLLTIVSMSWANDIKLTSPDGQMQVVVHGGKQRLTWEVSHSGTPVLAESEIGLNGPLKSMTSSTKSIQPSYISNRMMPDPFRTAIMRNKEFTVEFRVDNETAAYRISLNQRKTINVTEEISEWNFAGDFPAFVPYVNDNRGGERYTFSFESYYDEQRLSQIFADSLAINPLAVRLPDGQLAVVFDACAVDYPGMFLVKNSQTSQAGQTGLKAAFAPVVTKETVAGHARLNLLPTERAKHIATINDNTIMPWRVIAVVKEDCRLLKGDIAARYSPKCQLKDTSWIRPGKVAWDWWNNTNLTGVDFRAGMNTDAYKYYIDFASRNHLEYIIIDEGWSSEESLTEKLNPEIDLSVLLPYAKERGVGIILWSSWRNSIRNMEADYKHYADLGVAGFKVDFFDRDDQTVMKSAWQIADCAARNHLVVDYHGFRPNGLQYAYPNVLNFEGVKGLENSKWEPRDGNGPVHNQPRYDVLIPYLRMLVGPLDYTPGAMVNATRDCFFGNNNHPMSQGTRAHQVAMYTIFNAPLQMLADSPSKYIKEQETTNFITQIPTVFDEVVPLDGKLGEYAVIAKRKGNKWYVAAMNNWNPCDLKINLSPLFKTSQTIKAELFYDGVNANRDGTDYRHQTTTINPTEPLKINLAPGGGWNAVISM